MPRIRKKKTSDVISQTDTEATNPAADCAASTATVPRLKLSLRLIHGEDIAMGPGKAELLEAIARTGSISAAARSMDMSYRRAWMLVEVMNRCFKDPLVETSKGGSHGGGAWLSATGQEVLAQYRVVDNAAKQVASAYLGLFEHLLAQ